jgi:hypothetical protein
MKLTGKNRSTREKPVPVPLCPPQISHGLTRDQGVKFTFISHLSKRKSKALRFYSCAFL